MCSYYADGNWPGDGDDDSSPGAYFGNENSCCNATYSRPLMLVNKVRTENHLNPLLQSVELDILAAQRAREIARTGHVRRWCFPFECLLVWHELGTIHGAASIIEGSSVLSIHNLSLTRRKFHQRILNSKYTEFGYGTAKQCGFVYVVQYFRKGKSTVMKPIKESHQLI